MIGYFVFVYELFGIYIGGLGVFLFLIIFGVVLMYIYGEFEKLNYRYFYYKCFIGIYLMFWIVFIIVNVYFFLCNGGYVFVNVLKWMLIFFVFGIDGLVVNILFLMFYIFGEWFLGFIFIFYVVFLLLRYGVKKYFFIIGSVVIVLYVLMFYFYLMFFGLLFDLLFIMRLFELLFGMYFI